MSVYVDCIGAQLKISGTTWEGNQVIGGTFTGEEVDGKDIKHWGTNGSIEHVGKTLKYSASFRAYKTSGIGQAMTLLGTNQTILINQPSGIYVSGSAHLTKFSYDATIENDTNEITIEFVYNGTPSIASGVSGI